MGVGILDCDVKDVVYSCVEKTLGPGFVAVSLLFEGVDRRGARSLKRLTRLLLFSSDLSEGLPLGPALSTLWAHVGVGIDAVL